MSGNYSILVGTTGAGLFQSPDGGDSWSRIGNPFPGESQVRALASDPQSSNVVYAGANNGIYCSTDSGSNWVKLDSPMDGLNIWSIAVDPQDSDTIFTGTSPGMVFRTKDGGKRWKDLSVPINQECAIGSTRVTTLVVDPVTERIAAETAGTLGPTSTAASRTLTSTAWPSALASRKPCW